MADEIHHYHLLGEAAGQRDGQVGSRGRLADAALGAGDGDGEGDAGGIRDQEQLGIVLAGSLVGQINDQAQELAHVRL